MISIPSNAFPSNISTSPLDELKKIMWMDLKKAHDNHMNSLGKLKMVIKKGYEALIEIVNTERLWAETQVNLEIEQGEKRLNQVRSEVFSVMDEMSELREKTTKYFPEFRTIKGEFTDLIPRVISKLNYPAEIRINLPSLQHLFELKNGKFFQDRSRLGEVFDEIRNVYISGFGRKMDKRPYHEIRTHSRTSRPSEADQFHRSPIRAPYGMKDTDPFNPQRPLNVQTELVRIRTICEDTELDTTRNVVEAISRNRYLRLLYETHGVAVRVNDPVKVIDVSPSLVLLIQRRNFISRINSLIQKERRGFTSLKTILRETFASNKKKKCVYNGILILRCCQKHQGRVWLCSELCSGDGLIDVFDVDKAIFLNVNISDLYVSEDTTLLTEPLHTAFCCIYEVMITSNPPFYSGFRLNSHITSFLLNKETKFNITELSRGIINHEYHVIDIFSTSANRTIRDSLQKCLNIEVVQKLICNCYYDYEIRNFKFDCQAI